jgi:hypothetical protein
MINIKRVVEARDVEQNKHLEIKETSSIVILEDDLSDRATFSRCRLLFFQWIVIRLR